MLFSVEERLLMLHILPKQGNYATLKMVREFREELSLTEDEHESLDLKEENGSFSWNTAAVVPKEIEVSAFRRKLIVDALTQLDEQDKLTEDHIPLYERFVNG